MGHLKALATRASYQRQILANEEWVEKGRRIRSCPEPAQWPLLLSYRQQLSRAQGPSSPRGQALL